MIHDGRNTSFESRVTSNGFEVEIEPLVHPNTVGVDIAIIRTIADAIHRCNDAGQGVTVTIQVREKAQL